MRQRKNASITHDETKDYVEKNKQTTVICYVFGCKNRSSCETCKLFQSPTNKTAK